MRLYLNRTYLPKATHGVLCSDVQLICRTLELPWRFNLRNVSCIPEGRYVLVKRYSARFGWHIHVKNVPGRSFILFHSANDALRELRGCIAPVTQLTREGYGTESRKATAKLKRLVSAALDRGELVELFIQTLKF